MFQENFVHTMQKNPGNGASGLIWKGGSASVEVVQLCPRGQQPPDKGRTGMSVGRDGY